MDYGFDYNNNEEILAKRESKYQKRTFVLGIVFLVIASILFLACLAVLTVNMAMGGNDGVGGLVSGGTYYSEINVSSRDVLLNNGEKMELADAVEKVENSVVAIGSTEATANGSGVIITKDGFIVTNDHVVNGQESVYVSLHNGDVYSAQVWATDEKSDLAVIKIEPEIELIPATIGDSSAIRNGQTVFVIGNPTGELKGSVTSGIVSYENRVHMIEGLVMELIQIDAAVNGGNSGGGLFNEYGELIGIVNAKITGLTVESLGFAIPSNTVQNVATQLIEQKYVSGRPYLGLTIEARPSYSLFGTSYKYVVTKSIYCDEIKVGDEIIAVAGKSMSEYSSAQQMLYGYNVGDEIEIVVSRNGKTLTIKYILEEYKPS